LYLYYTPFPGLCQSPPASAQDNFAKSRRGRLPPAIVPEAEVVLYSAPVRTLAWNMLDAGMLP